VLCKFVIQGKIQGSSHDGSIIILSGVHHVSNFRFNFIALGTFELEMFMYKARCYLEVSKEARIKFKANRIGKLYMLLS